MTDTKVWEKKALSPDQAVQTEKKWPVKEERKAPVAPEKNERVALSPDQAVKTVKKSEKPKKVTCLSCGDSYSDDRETCPACGVQKN